MDIDCLTLEIRMLGKHLYQKVMAGVDNNLSLHQFLILGQIITNKDRPITQKEIEELFSIRRSTANHMFQMMEKNGYISREVSPTDARMKVIHITKTGFQAHDKFQTRFIQIERQLRKGFSEHELEMFRTMMRRIWSNADLEV